MRLHLIYSVTPGSCWYCTVKRAVPPIRGEGKSVQITGALRSATEPGVRICCTCFDIQQVRPCWEPKKLFHWAPNPLSAALNKGLQIFQKSNSHLKIMGARKVTWSKLYTQKPQILKATVLNLVAQSSGRPGFMHLFLKMYHVHFLPPSFPFIIHDYILLYS